MKNTFFLFISTWYRDGDSSRDGVGMETDNTGQSGDMDGSHETGS